ncbi:hypothetical protein GEMRC1_011128 [Eukaryota sp. GEM-RC1]
MLYITLLEASIAILFLFSTLFVFNSPNMLRNIPQLICSGVYGILFYFFYYLSNHNDSPYLAHPYLFIFQKTSVPAFVFPLWSYVVCASQTVTDVLILPSSFLLQVFMDGLLIFSFFLGFEYIGYFFSLWTHTSESRYYIIGAPVFFIFYHLFSGMLLSFFCRLTDHLVGIPDVSRSTLQTVITFFNELIRKSLASLVALICLFTVIISSGLFYIFFGYYKPQLYVVGIIFTVIFIFTVINFFDWKQNTGGNLISFFPLIGLSILQFLVVTLVFFDSDTNVFVLISLIINSLFTISVTTFAYYYTLKEHVSQSFKYISKPLINFKKRSNSTD